MVTLIADPLQNLHRYSVWACPFWIGKGSNATSEKAEKEYRDVARYHKGVLRVGSTICMPRLFNLDK